MTAYAIVLIAVMAAGLAAWWWFVRCDRTCAAADRVAQTLFERGELLSALALIDSTDARCRCARFTSGDASPQYAIAAACLRALLAEGRRTEAERVLAQARGSILRELAKR